jgi:hypothetical protein
MSTKKNKCIKKSVVFPKTMTLEDKLDMVCDGNVKPTTLKQYETPYIMSKHQEEFKYESYNCRK